MKKSLAITLLMLVSPLVFGHPGHAEGGLYADAAHVLLGLVTMLAIFGAGLLAMRAFQMIRAILQKV